MNIYSINQNLDNCDFLVPSDELDFSLIQDFKNNSNGVWTVPNWKPLGENKNSIKFNSSCYYSGILFLEKEKAFLLKNIASEFLDIYPVKINSLECNFYYIHIKNTINSVYKKHLINWNYSKIENSEITFDISQIDNKFIFNDAVLDYLCTDKFIEFCAENNIIGLCFKKIGITEN